MTRLVVLEWFADAVVVNLGLIFVLKLDKINVIKRVAGKNKKKTQSIIILFDAESDVKNCSNLNLINSQLKLIISMSENLVGNIRFYCYYSFISS